MTDWSLARKALHEAAIERMRPNPAWQAMVRKYFMTDIVKTLRGLADTYTEECGGLFLEAADEIERLRRQIDDLEDRLAREKWGGERS